MSPFSVVIVALVHPGLDEVVLAAPALGVAVEHGRVDRVVDHDLDLVGRQPVGERDPRRVRAVVLRLG